MLIFKKSKITIGEPNCDVSQRILKVKSVFEKAKIKVDISENIDAWLKTHVAFVIPLVCALYMCNTDIYHLAENKNALKLFIKGFKEALVALNKLNIPILPNRMKKIGKIPEWLLLFLMKKRFKSELAKIAIECHASVAKDEMIFLGKELRELIEESGVLTHNLDKLYSYL